MALPERVLAIHDYGGSRGGAEILNLEIRRGLRSRGVDARLLASDAVPFDEDEAPDYLFRGSTGPGRALRETANPSAVARLRDVLRDFDPQIVHLGMILTQTSPLVLPLLARRATVLLVDDYRPVCPKGDRVLPSGKVCTVRAGVPCLTGGCFSVKGWIPRMTQLGLFRRWVDAVDRVIAPSRAVERILRENGHRVDDVILHGVREDSVDPAQPGAAPTVAYAGRLAAEKGVDTLLRAFARLRSTIPEVRLLIVGDGRERAELETLARDLGLGEVVCFAGHRSWEKTQELLATAWVQCVPSVWEEPFGLVTAEAQLRGTAVVASRIGAQPELIVHGETGYLFPPGDSDALARILQAILVDAPNRLRVARRGREWARRSLTFDRMIDHLLEVYRDLLGENEWT